MCARSRDRRTLARLCVLVRCAEATHRRTVSSYVVAVAQIGPGPAGADAAVAVLVVAGDGTVGAEPALGTGAATSGGIQTGAVIAGRRARTVFTRGGTPTVAQAVLAPPGTPAASGTRRTLRVRPLSSDIPGRVVVTDQVRAGVV